MKTILLILLNFLSLPISATTLKPTKTSTPHPHPSRLLLRAPRNKIDISKILTSPPDVPDPTPTRQAAIRGSFYVCEKANFEGHCRYVGEDWGHTPGAEPCHDVPDASRIGSLEPAAFSYCVAFRRPGCHRKDVGRTISHAFIEYGRPLRNPEDIPDWLQSIRCFRDGFQMENRTFVGRNPIRLEPCEATDCTGEPWDRWIDEYPKAQPSSLTGVRPAHTMADWASVRSWIVESLKKEAHRPVYTMSAEEANEGVLMAFPKERGPQL